MAIKVTQYGWSSKKDRLFTPDFIIYSDGRVEKNTAGRVHYFGTHSRVDTFRTVGEYAGSELKYLAEFTFDHIIVNGFIKQKTYKRFCQHDKCLIDVADSCGGLSTVVHCNTCRSTHEISPFDEITRYDMPADVPDVSKLLNTGEMIIMSLADQTAYVIVDKTGTHMRNAYPENDRYFFSTTSAEYEEEALLTYDYIDRRINKKVQVYIVPFKPSTAGKNTKMAIREAVEDL